MEDHHHHHHQDDASRGSSKAQSGLQKILHTITGNQVLEASASSSSASSLSMEPAINPEKGKASFFNLDLNLPPPEEEEAEAVNAGEGAVEENGKISAEEECSERNGVGMGPDEEENKNKWRMFEALLEVAKFAGNGGQSKPIDPAELMLLVSIRDSSHNTSTTRTATDHELTTGGERRQRQENEGKRIGKKNAEEDKQEKEEEAALAAAGALSSPALRTRSRRAQVLPRKYSDSVMEPITTLSSRHNRSSSAPVHAHVPTKRRSTR